MAETKLIKFDKSNEEHVSAIKGGDVKIHPGGYFSKVGAPSPSKNNEGNPTARAVAKKITTPRKMKPVPMAEKPAPKSPAKSSRPAGKTAVRKPSPKKK